MDDSISRTAVLEVIREYCPDEPKSKDLREYWAKRFEPLIKVREEVEKIPLAGRWIPCKERLPEPGEYYLVTKLYIGWNCTEYREIDIAKYDFDGWHKADTVLAWCELPEPWKGGEK